MKKEEREKLEKERFIHMMRYEQGLYEQGLIQIAGIDEVGRGPLAGPVVAAAVILPKDFYCPGINDSKKLTEKKREQFFSEIIDQAFSYGIGLVEHDLIDEMNILNATKLAMQLAVENLSAKPEHLLIDAVKLDKVDIPQTNIIKGDANSVFIAAASIVAKVTRDDLMKGYGQVYPGYGFENNKGYGTKQHYEGIRRQGVCPIHRKSFLKNIV